MTILNEDIYEDDSHLVRCHGCSHIIDLYEEPAFPVYRTFDKQGEVIKTTYLCEDCQEKCSDYHRAKGVQSG